MDVVVVGKIVVDVTGGDGVDVDAVVGRFVGMPVMSGTVVGRKIFEFELVPV